MLTARSVVLDIPEAAARPIRTKSVYVYIFPGGNCKLLRCLDVFGKTDFQYAHCTSLMAQARDVGDPRCIIDRELLPDGILALEKSHNTMTFLG